MKKRLISLALSAVLACSALVGCGGSTGASSSAPAEGAAEETAAEAPADGEIKIGVSIWSSTDVLGSQCKLILDAAAEALGVTALCKNGSLLATKDFPAAWNDESVWRVDDEGEFHGLQLDLATLCNGVLTLYTANFGAEGTNYASFVIKDGSFADGGLSDTFYQSPE